MSGRGPEVLDLQAGYWMQDLADPHYIHDAAVGSSPWDLGTVFQPLPFAGAVAASWLLPPAPSFWGQAVFIGYPQDISRHIYAIPDSSMVHSLQASAQDDHDLFDQHPLIYQYVPSSTRPQDGQGSTLPPPANPSTILPFVSDQTPLPSVPPTANDLNAFAHILLPNEPEPPPPYPGPEEFAPAPNLVTQIRIDLEADIHPYFANYDRLTNNIHPLFRRQNFITQSCPADEPILLSRDQYAFLEPVLRLASRLITHHSALSAWARFLFPNATDPVAEQHRSASAVLEGLISTLRFCIGEMNALSQQPHRTIKVIPRRVFTAILTATTSARWADALMHQFGLAILFVQLIASSLSLPLPRATTDTTTTTASSAFRLGSDNSDLAAERITHCMFGVRGLKVMVVPCGFGKESVTVQHTSKIKEGSDTEGWFPVNLKWVERFFRDGFWEAEVEGVQRGLVVPGERRGEEEMM